MESGQITRRAESTSEKYLEELRLRPLNRYMIGQPKIEVFDRGEIITEFFQCLRLRSRERQWNVYTRYEVRKGDL